MSDIRHKEESDQIRLMRESMEDAREESRYEKYGMVNECSEILNEFLLISTEETVNGMLLDINVCALNVV